MNVVIIEDEPRAAKRLETLVKDCLPESKMVKWMESVADGIAFFKSQPDVDLIFSDIQLADDLSFEIFKAVEVNVPIIFTTAFNEYAIEAFKTSGIDYLLKPIKKEGLQRAIHKFERLTQTAQQLPNLTELAHLLQGRVGQRTFKKRFVVKVGTQLKTMPVDEIQAFYSKDKGSYLFTTGKRAYPIEQSMDDIESTVNPEDFMRINRGFIFNINAHAAISSYSNSRLKIDLEGLNEIIIVAREKTKLFKAWLEK